MYTQYTDVCNSACADVYTSCNSDIRKKSPASAQPHVFCQQLLSADLPQRSCMQSKSKQLSMYAHGVAKAVCAFPPCLCTTLPQ
jgi:hypothetical protein